MGRPHKLRNYNTLLSLSEIHAMHEFQLLAGLQVEISFLASRSMGERRNRSSNNLDWNEGSTLC